MNSSWQKYPKIEKSIRILQPKALDNNTRPTNPGIGCGTFLVCPDILMLSLPRHRHVPDGRGLLGDAKLIIATRPLMISLIYIASTGALYSTRVHRNRANSHTLRTKNLNSSYQGRKIKMKLADID
jgi:hypothetical protein